MRLLEPDGRRPGLAGRHRARHAGSPRSASSRRCPKAERAEFMRMLRALVTANNELTRAPSEMTHPVASACGSTRCCCRPPTGGTGKSSLVKALLELDSHLAVSVSHTTRAPRGQEQHGREYWFIDEADVPRDGRARRLLRVGRGARPPVRHLAQGDRGAPGRRRGRGARDRLAGRAADQAAVPARGADLHPAAELGRTAPAPAAPRRGPRPRSSTPAWPTPAIEVAQARALRLCYNQRPVRDRAVRPEDGRPLAAAEVRRAAAQQIRRSSQPSI